MSDRQGGQGSDDHSGVIDAEQFMRVSTALRDCWSQLEGAKMSADSRGRWQRRLIAVTNVAKHDLTRAEAQLTRLRADLAREVR
jgi:hypothetical protein